MALPCCYAFPASIDPTQLPYMKLSGLLSDHPSPSRNKALLTHMYIYLCHPSSLLAAPDSLVLVRCRLRSGDLAG